jgi:hypothetical protein
MADAATAVVDSFSLFKDNNIRNSMVLAYCCGMLALVHLQSGGTPACKDGSSSDSSTRGSTGDDSSSSAAVEQQLGMKPDELMARLIQRPDLLAKVQDPQVRGCCWGFAGHLSPEPWWRQCWPLSCACSN